MILNPSETTAQKWVFRQKTAFSADKWVFLQKMHFPAEKCIFLQRHALSCRKCTFLQNNAVFGGHVAGNRMKSQEDFRAQESRTLANFRKIHPKPRMPRLHRSSTSGLFKMTTHILITNFAIHILMINFVL